MPSAACSTSSTPTTPRWAAARSLRAHAREETIVALFGDGVTAGNAPGSKWCALDAIVEHHDRHGHPRPAQRRGAFLRKIADPTGLKARATALITAA